MLIRIFILLILLMLIGCNSLLDKINLADNLALSSGFTKEIIETRGFNLLTYYKANSKNSNVTIYIEGDGLAYLDRYRESSNPTPIEPVSLKLALIDSSVNVLYIARPCQYVPIKENPNCISDYWTFKRYAPEIIESIGNAVETFVKKNEIRGIRIVGFSGGGAIAAILATTRNDVIDLRTVAGNLDTNAFAQAHNASPLTGSLNPVDYADKLKYIPQFHFIGADDDIVPAAVINSYVAGIKIFDDELHCIFTRSFPDVTHTKGWETVWKQNVMREITCNK